MATNINTWSVSGKHVSNHVTPLYSTFRVVTRTFNQFAASRKRYCTSARMENSLTTVPCQPGNPLTLTGWPLPAPVPNASTSKPPLQPAFPPNGQPCSGTWASKPQPKSQWTTKQTWRGSAQDYKSWSQRKEQQFLLDPRDVARPLGQRGSVRSLRCGCVILTCSAHSEASTIAPSSSMTCPSCISLDRHKYISLTKRMKHTSIAGMDMQ